MLPAGLTDPMPEQVQPTDLPTGNSMASAAPAPDGVAVAVPLGPDDYRVTLQRNTKATIGMRLVQKKHTELPIIADIDPEGPAAHTDITVGDILLAVNGVDTRSSLEELKKALTLDVAAELTLRRTPSTFSGTAPHMHAPQTAYGDYDTNYGTDYGIKYGTKPGTTYSTEEVPTTQSSWLGFSECCTRRGVAARGGLNSRA